MFAETSISENRVLGPATANYFSAEQRLRALLEDSKNESNARYCGRLVRIFKDGRYSTQLERIAGNMARSIELQVMLALYMIFVPMISYKGVSFDARAWSFVSRSLNDSDANFCDTAIDPMEALCTYSTNTKMNWMHQ